MGSVLRQTYAREMVVCAFSFYQGSFQAMGGLKPGLRDFIVGPPPADTVDSTLADTGLPLFVLDFRAAPGNSIVREWLATPHRMRSIGAVYNELSRASYFAFVTASTFDVIFFVNRSTPARENRKLPHEMDIDFDRS
jgi:erythromycin esterase